MLFQVLQKIRSMNDADFNALCCLLGINDSQSGNAPVSQVNVTAKPSVMYPVNQAPVAPDAQKVQLSSMYGQIHNTIPAKTPVAQNKAIWHNLAIVSDPNFETEKSFAHVFQYQSVFYVFFIARQSAKMYNNVLQYGIKEDSTYTLFRIDDYQAKTKTKMQPVTGDVFAAMLGI